MNKISRILKYGFLILYSFISLFPFLWMIISSTNKSVDIIKGSLVPNKYLSENIRNLFANTNFLDAFINSLSIAISVTVLSLFIASISGFAFEIYKKSNKDKLYKFLIAAMMIPFSTLMIPLFTMIVKLDLMNTLLGVILPTILVSYLMLFFRQNTRMFIKEIIESARIDGLTEFGIFNRIYIPIMKNAYAAAAVVAFSTSWNSFLWPLIILQTPQKMTLPVLLSSMSAVINPNYGVVMLALVLSTIPCILVFLFFQKKFVMQMFGSLK